jgi:long-subunit fatty acid transport protein
MNKNWVVKTLCASIGLVLAQGALANDANTRVPSGVASIPFDLLPPGARSIALGGAFTAVADDATASEANPAGLTILTRPEVSISGRRTSFDLTNYNGDADYADVYDGHNVDPFPLYNKSSGDTNAVSFASYVHPFENGAFSVYYQNTGKIKDDGRHTGESTRFFDQFTFENNVDLAVDTLGISGAYRVNDVVSIGASVRYTRFKLNSLSRNSASYLFDLERPLAARDITGITDEVSFQRLIDDDDSNVTYNIGVLINPGGKWSFGMVYKDGGSYKLKQTNSFSALVSCAAGAPADNLCGQELPLGGTVLDLSGSESLTTKIDLPDVLNIGVAFRPTDTWLVSLDGHYTRFSQLAPLPAESLIFGNAAPNAFLAGTAPNQFLALPRQSDSLTWHFGVEHTFIFSEPMMMGMKTLAVRGGVFNQKDLGPYNNDTVRDLPGVDTKDTHYTVGLGSTFGPHVQVDLGAEFSKATDNIVLSAIYRF